VFLFLSVRRLFDGAVAAGAALLFALHPLAHEPLLYVFARSSSLAALFCLISLWFWLRERPGWATVCFALALLAKEEWVAFPFALALVDWARGAKLRWGWLAGMAALAAAAGVRVIYATKAVAGAGSGFGQATTPWEYFLLQGQAVPGYLWRIVVPVWMPIDPARPGSNLEGALFFWVVLAVVAWLLSKKEQAGFWVLPAVLLLLPSSSILPAADAVAYRRMYFPMAFVAIGIAVALRKWPRVLVGLVVGWAVLAGVRQATWRSEAAIWRESAELAPGKVRPLIQLARVSPAAEALALLDRAKQLAPDDAEVASERGRVWMESGNAAQALAEFGRALALSPEQARHMLNRGVALAALGQVEAAKADFERALAKDPCLAAARDNLRRIGFPAPPATGSCSTISGAEK